MSIKFIVKICFIFLIIGTINKKIESAVLIKSLDEDLFPVSIIHINDFHARYEETNNESNKCKLKVGETCIGGYARIVTTVKTLLEQRKNKNPIYLNAGDNFQGTLWYSILKWNVTSYFLNLLPADAITIGNHEFDDSIPGLIPFLETIQSPVVVANIDDTEEPDFQGKYNKSMIIDKYDRKIGVIGVILKTTNEISMTRNLKFLDEVDTVKAEAQKLKDQGVDIIIVLSHCGIETDRVIAAEGGPNIDVIVGGHSHTFLYSGNNSPGPDTPADEYPIVVTQSGTTHKVLIVQASSYSKYVGDLIVYFDQNGELQNYEGNPIFLNDSIEPDADIVRELRPWQEEVDIIGDREVGRTKVLLSRANCRLGECNLGNFITDAFVDYYTNLPEDDNEWTYGTISVTNAGGLRTSLTPGVITYDDVATTIPFENTIDSFELRGEYLLEALEYSASSYNDVNFLQVSGMKIVYNVTKPVNQRVQSVHILCRVCDVPRYEPLDVNLIYRLIVPSFIGSGGNGFKAFGDHRFNYRPGKFLDIDLVLKYMEKINPIMQGVEKRITVLE